jgi:LysR family transcriptional regulator, hydrogen peroxide-inducible genes activator
LPTLTQLEYIVAVHKHKHFARAAEECHVSQPSLSAQIQKVEEEINLIIFDRSKKPIITTERGEKFVAQAKVILREHKKLSQISMNTGELTGDFHLGVIPTLSAYIIPLFIESFSKKNPKVRIKVSEYKTEDIVKMLYDDELDGGLLVTPLHDDKIIERSLFFEPFYVFASAHHELFGRKFVRDDELDGSSVWLLNEGHCFRDQVIKICSLKNQNQVLKNVEFESGNLETLKNLIRRGHGYTLLPHLATLNLSKEEKVKNLIKFTKPVPTREVSLVHSRSFLKEKVIESLVEEIIISLPPELKSLKKGSFEIVDIK